MSLLKLDAKIVISSIRTKKKANYFCFQPKIKTLVTHHLAIYGFGYQIIMRVMSG